MKLVQLLAKELKEWPEGSVRAWQSGCDNEIYFDGANAEMFYTSLHADDSGSLGSKITRRQWQAEREKMNKPKWIRHRGGNTTLHPGTMIEARLRSGEIQRAIVGAFLWDNSLSDHAVNIMAYRVIEESKDQEIKEVEDTNLGTLSISVDANDVFKPMISSMKEMALEWGQIESPLKWRDEIIELEAYEEEFRREREKLICKLESEGFKLIYPEAAPCLRDEWEAMDYESFCVGDTVVCIHEKSDDTIAELTIGKEYRLILDDEQICVIDDIGDPMRYCIEIGCFKLVKRA